MMDKPVKLSDLLNSVVTLVSNLQQQVSQSCVEPAPVQGLPQLQPFAGTNDENVQDFIEQFEALGVLCRWPEDQKHLIFGLYLTGGAREWYLSLPDGIKRNYHKTKEAIKEDYSGKSYVRWLEFYHRSQKPEEPVPDYASDVSRKARNLGLSDNEKMHRFIAGLRPELKEDVAMARPKTFQIAVDLAILKAAVLKSNENQTRDCYPHEKNARKKDLSQKTAKARSKSKIQIEKVSEKCTKREIGDSIDRIPKEPCPLKQKDKKIDTVDVNKCKRLGKPFDEEVKNSGSIQEEVISKDKKEIKEFIEENVANNNEVFKIKGPECAASKVTRKVNQVFPLKDDEDKRKIAFPSLKVTNENNCNKAVTRESISSNSKDEKVEVTIIYEEATVSEDDSYGERNTTIQLSGSPEEKIRIKQGQELPNVNNTTGKVVPLIVPCEVQKACVKSTQHHELFTDDDKRLVPKLPRNPRRA